MKNRGDKKMKDLDNILMIARMNGYSDVHLGGKNHIMMRNNGFYK